MGGLGGGGEEADADCAAASQGADRREALLWSRLRREQLGHKFTKQFPIGRAVADFACRRAKLVVELDGGQHDLAADADAQRTRMIEAHRYTVIRYWNSDVIENLDGVLEDILRHLRIALD